MNNSCNCHKHTMQEPNVSAPLLKTKKTISVIPSVILSIFIAFFPKCPVCWAVYMSMFGSIGLAQLPYMRWLFPALLLMLGIQLFILLKRVSQQGYLPFISSFTGTLIILYSRSYFPSEKWLLIVGMLLIASGSLLNGFFNMHLLSGSKIRKS